MGVGNVWGETVGESDNSTTGSTSTPISISSGNSIHYVFTSTRNTSANGNGWILVVNNGSSDIIKLRNDIWDEVGETQSGTTSEFDWDNYNSDMNGATVDMTISLYNSMLMMRSVITTSDGTKTFRYNYSKALGSTPASLSISLMANYAYLNITTADKYTNGAAVKNVIFGTDNGDNTVTADDFSTTTATGWSIPDGQTWGDNYKVSIAEITEVAKPEIGSAPETGTIPTYVAGKCLALTERGRQGAIYYGTYTFDAVSNGTMVFDADIFGDGNYPSYVRFINSSGEAVLTMHWTDGNTTSSRAFRYQIGSNDEVGTSLGGKPRKYHGFGIRDLYIDLTTGAAGFKLDYINYSEKRAVSDAINFNIGTGKNIAGIQLGYVFNSGNSNVTQHSYMDNVKLYTVEPLFNYAINYTNGGNIIASDNGLAFAGATVNAAEEKDVSDIIYVPASGETTSFTVSAAASTNVWSVAMVGSAPYTINYKYNGETVETQSGNAEVGTTVDATYPVSLWKSEVKYFVKDGETTTFTIANGTNIFDIDLRLAATDAVATVNAKNGATTVKTFTQTGIEGENVTVYFTHVVYDSENEKYYVTNDAEYGKSLTYGNSTDVTYTEDATIVYYGEVEDITNNNMTSGNYSGGQYATTAASTAYKLGTFPAAVYEVEGYNTNTSYVWRGLFLRKANSVAASNLIIGLTSQTDNIMSGEFTLPTSTDVYFTGYTNAQNKINQSAELDYIIIRKTADLPSTATLSVTSAGYSTFSSDYNLDFSENTDVTAYVATAVATGSVTMTSVTTVPAKTGLYIKSNTGAAVESTAINVTTSAVAAPETNYLKPGTGASVAASTEGAYHYVLASQDDEVGFFNLAEATVVAAGKAYLETTTDIKPASGNARVAIIFDGETTGIKSVHDSATTINGCYNLSGQRISQPSKGLFIVNGKKVIK